MNGREITLIGYPLFFSSLGRNPEFLKYNWSSNAGGKETSSAVTYRVPEGVSGSAGVNVRISNDPKISSNTPVEHIFWPIIIPGEYEVQVNHYTNHLGVVDKTSYFVTIMVNGEIMFEYEGEITLKKTDSVVKFEFDKQRNFKIINDE